MEYKAFSKFILRTPYYPLNYWVNVNSRDDLEKLLKEPEIQEALYVASPVLYKELIKYLNGELINGKEISRLINSSSRYISRMSTRCTPFGLFAGCSVGEVNLSEDIARLELDSTIHRTTRLDMLFVNRLCESILRDPDIKYKITYYSNTSLYKLFKTRRYVEALNSGNKMKHRITEVANSVYLDKILKLADMGTTYEKIKDLLVKSDVDQESAEEYVNDLIDSQILQNELNQSVTGGDLLTRLINLLSGIKWEDERLSVLCNIQNMIDRLDNEPHDVNAYGNIIEQIKKLRIPYEEKYIFQVDYYRECSKLEIGKSIQKELKSALTFLSKITPAYENPALFQFKQDFIDRYESRQVPLMEALDPDVGLGYPSNNSVEFPTKSAQKVKHFLYLVSRTRQWSYYRALCVV